MATGLSGLHPQRPGFTTEEDNRFQQLVNQTQSVYLTFKGTIFDAQYRANNGNPTESWENVAGGYKYLVAVPDPVVTQTTIGPGFAQIGSQRWSGGTKPIPNANNYPQWQSYLQILTHYYTGIQVVQNDGAGNINTLTPDFRWNMLVHQTNPPTPAPGSSFVATVTIQNTGVVTWPVNSNYPLISDDVLFFTTQTPQRYAVRLGSGQSTGWFNQLIPPPGAPLNSSFMPIILKE